MKKLLLFPLGNRIMLLLLFLILSVPIFSQGNQKVSIKEALTQVTRKFGTKLVFDPDIIAGKSTTVNVKTSAKTIEDILKEILYPEKLLFLYVGVNHYAIVKSNNPNLEPQTNIAKADGESPNNPVIQPMSRTMVSGMITDQNNVPLVGVTIIPEGSRNGTSSSSDGRYHISFPGGYQTLIFSHIGMESQRVPITGAVINVIMKNSYYNLNEVTVVSDGYTKVSKESTTGSYAIITSKDLAQVPTINMMERLEGKVPGVKFDLRNNRIQIRSSNTFSDFSEPLIVIDGFPMISIGDNQKLTGIQNTTSTGNSVVSFINPADVEQITFLKDAAATAIWGARAANGVVVIETKKGKRATPTLSFSSNFSVSAPPSISKLKWMNSAQYIDLEQEMVNKNFLTDPLLSTNPFSTPNNSEAQEWMFKVKRGTATNPQRDSALAVLGTRSNQSQIEKYLLQQAVSQQYNLSVSGGGDNNTYYFSANYNKDQPIYRSNAAQSANITANFTSDLFKKRVSFRTGFNYLFSSSTSNGAAIDALSTLTQSLRPYDMLMDEAGNLVNRTLIFRPEIGSNLEKQGYLPFTYNTIDQLDYSNTTLTQNQIRLTAGLNAKIANWLNVDFSGMTQRFISRNETLSELNSYTSRVFVNTGTSLQAGKLVYGVPYGGTLNITDASNYDNTLRAQFNANHTWQSRHQVTALGGVEIRETYRKGYSSTRYGFDVDNNTFQSINPTIPYTTMYGWTSTLSNPQGAISEAKNRYLSYFTNASYSYNSKYILTGSMRFEDYTLVGIDRKNRAIPLWSLGLKWNAKQESFLENIDWLSNLGVRASYGTGGSVPLAGYVKTVVSVSGTDAKTQQPIARIDNPANQDLGWETTRTLNAGLDFGIFNNRLTGVFDIYTKKSYGILASLPYNATYGWSNVFFNSGTAQSHGLEFGLTGKVVSNKDWAITSTFNFAYSAGKVTDSRYVNNAATLTTATTPLLDYPMGYVFVYKWAGLDETGQSMIYDKNNNIVKHTTNTTALTKDDLKYAGVRIAPFYGGFFNSFRYKNLELGVQVTYYMGHVFLKQSITNYPTFSGVYSGVIGRQEDLAYRWKKAGDEATSNVPGLTGITANSVNRYRYSDLMVRSADNIRLQQISLAYSLPKNVLPASIKNLSLSASARNLGLLWAKNNDGIDPEYLNSNNYSNLPPTPNYVFSINASF